MTLPRLKIFGFMAFVWIGFMPSTSAQALQSHALEQGPDIPPAGSSVFDQIFSTEAADGSVKYEVPFPLERLTERLNQLGATLVHTMLPFSRSLQRPLDLSYDPILNPRIVITSTKDQASLTRGRLFMGYVKAKDQLEIISFNDQAGRFEFQIVMNYSKDPQVFYVDRGKCLSCHQSHTPIFSPPGWQDTAFGVMGDLLVTKLGIPKNDPFGRTEVAKRLFGELKSEDNVATFDLLVRESSEIAFDERLWREGCGASDECRLGLLLRTLSPNSRDTDQAFNHSRKVITNSKLAKGTTFSSFLVSTPLNAPFVIQKYGSLSSVVNTPAALLEIITSLYNLKPSENPATPRPVQLAGRDLVTPLTSFLPSDLETLKREIPDPDQVARILRKLMGDDSYFSHTIQKNKIMHTLLSEVGSEAAREYAHWLNKPTPEKSLFKGPLLPVFQQRELNLFSRHCSSCHAAGHSFPPQFLLGTEDEVNVKIRSLRDKILWKLESNLMPPDPKDRETFYSSGDYETIINYLRQLQ